MLGVPSNWLRSTFVWWLPVILGLTGVANLVINEFVPRSGQALRTHSSSSLTDLVQAEGDSLGRTYAFYFALGDAAVGDHLVLPADSVVDTELASDLSGVTVIERSYDPAGVSLDELTLGEPGGELSSQGITQPYWIITDTTASVWWLAQTSEGIVIVPASMVAVPAEP